MATNGTPNPSKRTNAQLEAEIAQLRAQLASTTKGPSVAPVFKTSSNGGLILYGIGSRFPVTLHTRTKDGQQASGWRIILQLAEDGTLRKAIEAHEAGQLEVKTPKAVDEPEPERNFNRVIGTTLPRRF